MDSITQAALGAAIGEAVLGKKIGNKGAIIGAVVATIPDLDVALYLFYDSFDMLSIHRGFSHSILFSVLMAFLLAYFLQRMNWTKNVSYRRLWICIWLALFTHMLLDAFTAYGTQLLLPFSDVRISFDSINIVDPLYTAPLLIGLFCTLFLFRNQINRSRFNRWGLIISSVYLLSTLAIKSQVERHFKKELSTQNIKYNSLLTMPVGIASIKWYGLAKTDLGLYMHAYTIGNDLQTPFQYFPTNDHLLEGVDSSLVDRMRWFAKGFYTVAQAEDRLRFYNLQVDMRGVIDLDSIKAPTAGYFEIIPRPDGRFDFSSSAH